MLLQVGFFSICGLLGLNLALAVGVRLVAAFHARRERTAKPRIAEKVALYAVGVDEEMWPPRRRYERRLLRDAMLEAAGEVSGDGHDRLAQLFDEFGYVREAERDLGDRSALKRVKAAEALGEMGAASSAPALLAGLADGEPLVRYACAQGLAAVGADDAVVPILRSIASGEENPSPAATAEILLHFGAPAVEQVRRVLDSAQEPRVRWLIAVVLGELRALDAVPELLRCLRDPDDELCARAAHALGKVGEPKSALALAAVAVSGQRAWFVRTAAAAACGQIGNPAVTPALVVPLDDGNWFVRNAAAKALAALGDAGLGAVCNRVGALSRFAIQSYWGYLDVEHRTEEAIGRAADGDPGAERLVAAACRSGCLARLTEVAGGGGPAAAYAAELLEHAGGGDAPPGAAVPPDRPAAAVVA